MALDLGEMSEDVECLGDGDPVEGPRVEHQTLTLPMAFGAWLGPRRSVTDEHGPAVESHVTHVT